jgi:hypothetical protein
MPASVCLLKKYSTFAVPKKLSTLRINRKFICGIKKND